MIIEFIATDVSVDEEPGLIGFTNVDSEQYFYLQPAELSNGDFDPTKEQIWLERDDQGYGGPGTDWSIVLKREHITINSGTDSGLQCSKIEIDFNISDEEYESMTKLLKKVMCACAESLTVIA